MARCTPDDDMTQAPATRRSIASASRPSTGALLAVALGASACAGGAFAQTTRTVTTVGTGAGSLQNAVFNSVSGDTINFDPAIQGSTLSIFNELTINNGVTIDGGGTTLNGRGTNRLFFVDSGGEQVVLRDLTLINGANLGDNGGQATADGGGGGGALGAGGAIAVASGNLVLEDVSLDNNRAIGGDGGSNGQGPTVEQSIDDFTALVDEDFEEPEGLETVGGFGGRGGSTADFVFGGRRSTEAPEAGVTGADGLDGDSGATGSGGGGGAGGQTGGDGADEDGMRDSGGGGNGGNGGTGAFGAGGGGYGPRGFGGEPAENGFTGLPGDNGLPGEGGVGAGDGLRETGGGGAGLGGAIFVDEGATLTIRVTEEVEITDNLARRGRGGTPTRNDGQEAGALAFGFGGADLDVDVLEEASLTLDGSDIADASSLRDSEAFVDQLGLRKTGAGSLTLINDPAFSGALSVAGGLLSVNGDYAANGLTVEGGGTLGGIGRVAGFTNDGRVAPGNSVGTLTVAGDFTQGAGGTLEVEFGSDGIDLLDVEGDATLGGTVSFVELDTGVNLLEPLTFVSADGELTGVFATEEQFLASGTNVLEINVEYDTDADIATATFVPVEPDFSAGASSGSAGAIGAALTGLADDPADAAAILNAINSGLPLDSVLQSQGNVLASSAVTGAQLAMTTTTTVARNRVSGVAVAARDARQRYYSEVSQFEDEPDPYLELYGDDADRTTASDASGGRAESASFARADDAGLVPALWVEGVGAFGDIDGDGTAFGSDSSTYGVSAGGEIVFNDENTVFGVFVGYTNTDTDVDDLDDSAETDNLQVGLYASHRFNDQWHANAAGSVSFLSFDTERGTALGTATGGFDGLGATGTAEVLYDFDLGHNIRISPLAGVEAAFIDRDGYTESGAGIFNLDVDDGSNEYLSHVIGVEGAIGFPAGMLDWILALRAGWAHQYLDTAASTTSRFALGGDDFTTSSAERDEDSFRLGAHVEFTPLDSHQWTAFARYDLDLAGNFVEHAVRAGFRLSF